MSAQTIQIIVLVGVVIYLAFFIALIRFVKASKREEYIKIGFILLVVLFSGFILASIPANLEYYRQKGNDLTQWQRVSISFQIWLFKSKFLFIPVTILAVILFIMKRRKHLAYGMIELSFAWGLLLYASFTQQKTNEERAFAAMAALYVIIRGLEDVTTSVFFAQSNKLTPP